MTMSARLPFVLLVGSPALAVAVTFAMVAIDRAADGGLLGRSSEAAVLLVNGALAAGGSGAAGFLSRRTTRARVGFALAGAACGAILYGLLVVLGVVAVSLYDLSKVPPRRVSPPPPSVSAAERRSG